jgi:hypothetical protein
VCFCFCFCFYFYFVFLFFVCFFGHFGQGEPLNNYSAVLTAVRTMVDPKRFGLSPAHVTVSTVGIVPYLIKMTEVGVLDILNHKTISHRAFGSRISHYPLSFLMYRYVFRIFRW